jgi:predicted Ser/Thr protein kinase
MPSALDDATERALIDWIESHRDAVYARGYQGETYLYQADGRRLIVKVASGRGLRAWVRRRMLERERKVYRHLDGFDGSPRCYELARAPYLVLDYVDAVPARRQTIIDPAAFFDALLARIEELHRRGVAHADLKRKANVLVIDGRVPCLIDFGTAVVRKPGWAPVNHWLYELARRFDYNAWAKLKYDGRFEDMTAEDRAYYRLTWVEAIARAIKRAYLPVKRSVLAVFARPGR